MHLCHYSAPPGDLTPILSLQAKLNYQIQLDFDLLRTPTNWSSATKASKVPVSPKFVRQLGHIRTILLLPEDFKLQ